MQQPLQQRQPPPQIKMGWLERMTYGSQHNVFRITAIVLSSWSALSVYTMFSGNDANPVIKQFMDVSSTVAFVALGYFVLRGWAHRMKEGKPVASYAVLSVLYAGYEVACNLSVFSGQNATTAWLVGLHNVLLSISAFVKSMMPIFAMSMARVEVDLMAERGALSVAVSQTKQPVPAPVSAINRPSVQPKLAQNGARPGQQNSQRPGVAPQPQQNQQRQPGAGAVPDRGRQQLRQDQAAAATWQGQPARQFGSKNPLQGHYQRTRDDELSDDQFLEEELAMP